MSFFSEKKYNEDRKPILKEEKMDIINCLIKKYTVEEIEQIEQENVYKARIEEGSDRIPNKPFGFIQDTWEKLKSMIKEGDELWSFSSGYAVIREGQVLGTIFTRMN